MANEKGTKKDGQDSSAEDILGQLAQEMGVDEDAAEDVDSADVPADNSTEDAAETADAEAEEAEAAPEPTDEGKAESAPSRKDRKKGAKAARTPEPSPEPTPVSLSALDALAAEARDEGAGDDDAEVPSDWIPLSDDEAISTLFSGKGTENPVRPVAIDEEDEINPSGSKLGWILFAVFLVAGAGLLGGYYTSLDDDRKECLRLNLKEPGSCDEYFKAIEEERIAEANRQRLANAPKYGTLQITTDPRSLRITADGQDTLVFPGTRTDLMVPVRSQISFENISVTEPFTFTIHGEGVLEDRQVTVSPFDAPDSPWIQNQTSGDYYANLTYSLCWPGTADAGAPHCLAPVADSARELRWRLSWRPPVDAPPEVPSRLPGTITVTSEPSGAAVLFNGQQLYDEETGTPYTTPHTFSTYNAPRDREDRTPLEVYLSRDGLRITVGMEGKVQTADGVYSHYFRCEPVPGRALPPVDAENPDFLGYCNYTYSVHLVLRDPPPEAPAEGSGDAPAATE
jgi:hypothetical protein